MTINSLHSDGPFAYKKYHSIETMMLGLSDEVLMGFECTIIVFLDLNATFDKLLEVLNVESGILGVAL